MVSDRTSIDIHALLARHDYWFATDSLNEGGITNGSATATAIARLLERLPEIPRHRMEKEERTSELLFASGELAPMAAAACEIPSPNGATGLFESRLRTIHPPPSAEVLFRAIPHSKI
jgi:hypothetical protein